MKEIVLEGSMLSPMFSYGADQTKPEFRAAALKGMMRCLYRMVYPGDVCSLAKTEADLFGGMVGTARENQGHASPIQLLVTSKQESFCKERLLQHKIDKNPEINRLHESWKTTITIRNNKQVTVNDKQLAGIADLNWYQDLIKLTLLLCGMGKRSRKGRGRVEITGQLFANEDQTLNWICKVLNALAVTAGEEYAEYYRVNNRQIELNRVDAQKQNDELRPTIIKIELGEKLHREAKGQNNTSTSEESFSVVNRYLRAVDQACHNWKGEQEKKKPDPIGKGNPRFASSLLIGFIRVGGDIYPIYTFVKAVIGKRFEIDQNCTQREDYIVKVMKFYNEIIKNKS